MFINRFVELELRGVGRFILFSFNKLLHNIVSIEPNSRCSLVNSYELIILYTYFVRRQEILQVSEAVN